MMLAHWQDCFVRSNWMPKEAQRLQHGAVRVLKDLTGMQIVGGFDGTEIQPCLDMCAKGLTNQPTNQGLWKGFDNDHGFFQNHGVAGQRGTMLGACSKKRSDLF